MLMTSEELRKSWHRTVSFLWEARRHFSHSSEAVSAEEFHQFAGYLEHNELEPALDSLEAAFEKSGREDLRVLELMALAAASMNLQVRRDRYDERLSLARGRKYQTVLPA